VESTYNWYWLGDGLLEAGYQVHLANTAAIQQYEGLKYTDDRSDARWLAHLLRLGILPEGYIYPKEERAVQDLLRKRSQLVRQKTANVLSIENLLARNLGSTVTGNRIKQLTEAEVEQLVPEPEVALAIKSNLAVRQCLEEQIERAERAVLARVKLREAFHPLLTVSGIGQILGMTIMLETGDIGRFATVGTLPPIVGVWPAKRSATGNVRAKGMAKTGISIWPGRSWRPRILRFVTTRG
jgi:transposase